MGLEVRFRSFHDYARSHGFGTAVPTFTESGHCNVYSACFLRADVVEWRDILQQEGLPPNWNIKQFFQLAHNESLPFSEDNTTAEFVSGFPTFHTRPDPQDRRPPPYNRGHYTGANMVRSSKAQLKEAFLPVDFALLSEEQDGQAIPKQVRDEAVKQLMREAHKFAINLGLAQPSRPPGRGIPKPPQHPFVSGIPNFHRRRQDPIGPPRPRPYEIIAFPATSAEMRDIPRADIDGYGTVLLGEHAPLIEDVRFPKLPR